MANRLLLERDVIKAREVTIDVKDDYKVGLGNCK